MQVVHEDGGHRLSGSGGDVSLANRYLDHLSTRAFAATTIRTYAFHLLSFFRFCEEHDIGLASVQPTDFFEFLDWLSQRQRNGKVIRLASGAAPATMNQRIAAVRGLFDYAVLTGARADNPVPAARRSTGWRGKRRGLLGHIASGRPRSGGRLVREPNRLPEALEPDEVSAFVEDLNTHRDRAMALAMLLGGLRSAEVRSLKLADVDQGLRRLRVVGKGEKERIVPVDRAFFSELASYLRDERPAGCATPGCFVVLRGPTRGARLTEAGMRRIFRTHRERCGATRVRPHRLRHTYGTELEISDVALSATLGTVRNPQQPGALRPLGDREMSAVR